MRYLFAGVCCLLIGITSVRAQSPETQAKPGSAIDVEVRLIEWKAADADLAPSDVTAEKIAALEKSGKLSLVKRLQVTTCENIRTSLQVGERRARVVASTARAGGVVQNQVTYETVGTMLRVTPVTVGDRIQLELTLEHSAPRARENDPILSEQGGDKVRAESSGTLQLTTVVSLKDGQTGVIGGVSEQEIRQALLVRVQRLP